MISNQLPANPMQVLLSKLSEEQPELAQLLTTMQQQRQQQTSEAIEPLDAEIHWREQSEQALSELKRAKAVNNRLLRIVDDLKEALEQQANFEDALAMALGACPDCWGESVDCPNCAGRGRPGHFAPNPAQFNRWVLPTLRRHPHLLNGLLTTRRQSN
ncbi:hypothetical protein [Spirosoma sp.]|uniref:hypothetical protein n=1 Tax=Spirosoma sp. TaxID=1899569 RepID=UPI00260FE5A5|nr:hypothetical protein [Spirosoma sp.]MCX6215277.1 hypothetical protein [Spirosoma sp.]